MTSLFSWAVAYTFLQMTCNKQICITNELDEEEQLVDHNLFFKIPNDA